ncbi:MAG: translocation/assembly module TamB [Spirochaetaceae bacterium]|jgi:hypothetical protein|nr:translocation/assembly module TamB [Spirochaetaceae bacterium]
MCIKIGRKGGFDIQIILFAAVVLATVILFRPLQRQLLSRVGGLRDTFIERLETLLGKNIAYGSIGPSILGTIDIKDIRIYGGENDVLTAVGVKRLRVRYSVAALLAGKTLEALSTITVESPFVEAAAGKDIDELFDGGGGGIDGIFESIKKIASLVPERLVLRIAGGTFRFKAGESKAELTGIAFSAQVIENILRFRLSVRAEANVSRPQPVTANLSFRADGVYDIAGGRSGMKLRVGSVKTSYFSLARLNLLASLTENAVSLQKAGDTAPFDLAVKYDFDTASVSAQASFAGFRLSRLFSFSPEFDAWNSWLQTRLSGGINASLDRAGELAYQADLSGIFGGATPPGGGNFALDVSGNSKSAFFNRLDLSLSRGSLSWTGRLGYSPVRPDGALTVKDFNFTKSGSKDRSNPLNGSFIVSSYGNTVSFFAETLTVGAGAMPGSVEFQPFDINIEHSDSELNFAVSAFRVKNVESYDAASFVQISADGSFDFDSKNMEVRLKPDSFSLYDLLKMAGCAVELPGLPVRSQIFLDNILLSTEIFVSAEPGDLLFNVPHLVAGWSGDRNIWASLSLSGTEGSFELNEGHIFWNDGGIDITASGSFADINDMIFNAGIGIKDTLYTFDAAILEKNDIHISSSLGLNLDVRRSPIDNAFTGLLLLDAPRFPLGNGFAEIKAESDFRYNSPVSWELNLEKFVISGVKTSLSTITSVEIIGRVDQDGAEFSRIYFDDGRGALYGSANGDWQDFFRQRNVTVTGNLDLRDTGGGETMNAELRYDEESFFVWAEVKELQSGRFFNSADNMFITGNIGFFNTSENWSVAFDLLSLRGVLNRQPITLSGRASLDGTRLDLNETRLSYGNFSAEIPFLYMDLKQSSLSAYAHVQGMALDSAFDSDLGITAGFSGIDSWFNIRAALESFDGVINFENTSFSTFDGEKNFDFRFSRNGQVWNIEGGPSNMVRLHMDQGGDFFASFSYPAPVHGTIVGFIRNGRIEAEASNFYVDLSSLWNYIPMNRISIAGGFVLVDVRITGPFRDPEFFGTAMANSLRLSVPDFIADEIGPTPAFLTLAGNEIRLEPLSVRIGRGEGSLSGSLRISRWRPSSFEAALAVKQDKPIPINMNMAGFFMDGTVFGLLKLSGDGQTLNVSGNAGSDEIEISLSAEDSGSRYGGSGSQAMSVQTDITITAGKKVEFIWPNTNIPILQAYAASGSGLRIVSDTLSGHFSLKGEVDIRGGEVFYFQRSFYIKEGSLNFNESEIQVDPRLSVVAETRDRTNNEPVTVSMIVDNQTLSSFEPSFEATPALSQIEIFTLLGNNLSGTPTEDNAIERAFVSSTADVIAQFGVIRQFEKTVRDFLHIDMFSLRTQVLQNTILLTMFRGSDSTQTDGTLQSQTQTQTQTENELRIGNYFDNTTVFLGKYIGAGLFVQAMFSLRYDPLRTDMGGLWIEPDLSMEFKGPLFDIRWELVPTHPENIWITDNKITLLKKWTLP